ncbi:hypothetical protein [Streptomyces millisiae]|uniref:Secreted protein n=1 Tax=Streptomyces millisiae TaxID=3075542 RepID=A0ABU2LQU6_9ACTN|nr:hypothetical protein [Streptomyces sp. DSM 44918]MDT0319954.1 hypothetical protein [Streptomyces sp. DSM 44918]
MLKLRRPAKRTVLRAGAVLVAAVALPVLASPSAQAIDWDHTMHTDDADPGGRLRFEALGDIVQICDIEADGWAVEVEVYDTVHGYDVDVFSVGGNGNCVDHDVDDGHNLVEGRYYRFTVSLVHSGGLNQYHDYATWKA